MALPEEKEIQPVDRDIRQQIPDDDELHEHQSGDVEDKYFEEPIQVNIDYSISNSKVPGSPVNASAAEALSKEVTEIEESPDMTPPRAVLQGRVAPPSTPFIDQGFPHSSGMIGASVNAIEKQKPLSREGYLDRNVDDEVEETSQFDEIQSFDGITDADSVSNIATTVERVDLSSLKAVVKPVSQASESTEKLMDDNNEEEPVASESSKDGHHLEEASSVAIPAVIAASSIGIMAMATQQKSERENHHLEVPPSVNDSVPLIRVITPKPPTLEIHGPFVEPLKHRVQPEEIRPGTPTYPHSPTLAEPSIPIPVEPTHLPPMVRPATSYSWLGALFQPISPDVVEAQRTGWVAISTEIVNDPPVRRSSTKLRKKLRDIVVEQGRSRDSDSKLPRGCGIM